MSAELESAAGTSGNVLSLLKAVGGFTRPSGRGWFMFRCLTVGTGIAAVCGVFGAFVLAAINGGGALGFVLGSCLGFCGGSLNYYGIMKAESQDALRKYPRIMEHHLRVNFPRLGFDGMDIVGMVARERAWMRGRGLEKAVGKSALEMDFGRVGRTGQCISAYQTALPTILEIENQKEQAIIIEFLKESEEQS